MGAHESISISDYAAIYAAMGLRPIRIANNGKVPVDKKWTALTRCTAEEAFDEFKFHDGNIGLSIPDGLVALDLDVRIPGGGLEALEAHAAGRELPATPTQVTPSGGRHMIYTLPPGYRCKNAVGVLPGVDIRTRGGQIVAEPSQIDGRAYQWLDLDVTTGEVLQFAPLPTWLYGLLGVHRMVDAGKQKTALLHPDAHGQVKEGKRNDTLFRMACSLRRRGASEEGILQALQAINQADCFPPLEDAEVARIAASAARYDPAEGASLPEPPSWATVTPPLSIYRSDPPGMEETTADSGPPDDGLGWGEMGLVAAHEIPKGRLMVKAGLIEDVLPDVGIVMMYGPSNCGKTFVTLDMACAIARGIPWHRQLSKQTGVLYLAAESPTSVLHRVKAYQEENDIHDMPLYVGQRGFNINDPRAHNAILKDCREIDERYGNGIGLIIIDTLSSAMPGTDENDSSDMSRTMAALMALQRATGALIIFVHHAGKDIGRGARGWSGMRAWVDTEIAVTEADENGVHVVEVTKHRTMSGRGRRYGFSLRSVVIGINEWGHEVSTCVIDEEEAPAKEGAEPDPTPASVQADLVAGDKAQAFILRYLAEHGPSCSMASVIDAGQDQGHKKASLYKAKDRLTAKGTVTCRARVLSLRQ